MGKVLSHMKRPFQNYNVESRAHKVISQNKPVAAPHHKVEQIEIAHILKENPAEFQEKLRKHEELNRNLKKVFVTSESKTDETSKPKRPLPLSRSSYSLPVFGVVEPVHVSKGKVSLLNALKFITDHHADARLCTTDSIVRDYELPEATVKNILRYCKTFEIYIPEDKNAKTTFAGPTVQRIQVTTRPSKQLPAGKEKNEDSIKKIEK